MNESYTEPGNQQAGFTLMEMLVVLAIIVLLAFSAQTLSRLSFTQLHYLTRPELTREESMYRAWQWLENDILQMRGDLPWKMDVSMDATRCLQAFTLVTENNPAFDIAEPILRNIRYRIDGGVLYRDIISKGQIAYSRELLSQVDCLHPRFWQQGRWQEQMHDTARIYALSFALTWKGPKIERFFPVEISPVIQQDRF